MQQDTGNSSSEALIEVIERNLYNATSKSLPVDILVDLARKVYQNDQTNNASKILPKVEEWEMKLNDFLTVAPAPSLSFTTSLGGAIALIDRSAQASNVFTFGERDSDSFSPALRMALYTSHVLQDDNLRELLDSSMQADYYRLLLLTTQLVNDKITVSKSNQLWTIHDSSIETEMSEMVSRCYSLLSKWHSKKDQKASFVFVEPVLEAFLLKSTGLSPEAFYNARAYGQVNSEMIESNGWHGGADTDLEGRLKTLRKSPDLLVFASFLTAFKLPLSSTQTMVRFCNELIADLTGTKLEQGSTEALKQLILLNIVLQDDNHIFGTIAKQRTIFFVKHIIPWLGLGEKEIPLQTECCKALSVLLPSMKDVYGDHWTSVFEALILIWSRKFGPATLSLSHASLKLFAALVNLTRDEETSDDFTEAWQESIMNLSKGLINTLKQSGNISDEGNQPLRIVNELLARQLNKIPMDTLENTEELFPLLSAESAPVQTTAFEILHKQIPALQEQISIDVALEKTEAKLPEELLSLILESPNVSNKAGQEFGRAMPPALRCYLSSWLLVFDHFKKAVSIKFYLSRLSG